LEEKKPAQLRAATLLASGDGTTGRSSSLASSYEQGCAEKSDDRELEFHKPFIGDIDLPEYVG
jgi:hypothetical protein